MIIVLKVWKYVWFNLTTCTRICSTHAICNTSARMRRTHRWQRSLQLRIFLRYHWNTNNIYFLCLIIEFVNLPLHQIRCQSTARWLVMSTTNYYYSIRSIKNCVVLFTGRSDWYSVKYKLHERSYNRLRSANNDLFDKKTSSVTKKCLWERRPPTMYTPCLSSSLGVHSLDKDNLEKCRYVQK